MWIQSQQDFIIVYYLHHFMHKLIASFSSYIILSFKVLALTMCFHVCCGYDFYRES